MGDADPAVLKERCGDKVCLMGGVDAVNEVYLSRPEDIRGMVRERLAVLKPGGGYILDGSNSLVWETPAENVRAFTEAGLEYGRY
jgi:uroporphyrinogen-III decarboxylase